MAGHAQPPPPEPPVTMALTPLAQQLLQHISTSGAPLRLDAFMQACLTDPEYGYYTTRQPLGRLGDFTTAPEVHQAFGEVIGAWVAHRWQQMGSPSRWVLVEWGPGRGTLMRDILRSLSQLQRALPALLSGMEVQLVDTSPTLQQEQRQALTDAPCPILWQSDCLPLPPSPTILVANEFLDALPIRQFRQTLHGWEECYVAANDSPADPLPFRWQWHPHPQTPPLAPTDTSPGQIYEYCPLAHQLLQALAAHSTQYPLTALCIDYGYRSGQGDSLQALYRHQPCHPLHHIGEADLTTHVDFARLSATLQQHGARVEPILTQSHFLLTHGLQQRMETLGRHHPEHQLTLAQAFARLVSPEHMGELFKVMVAHSAFLPPPVI